MAARKMKAQPQRSAATLSERDIAKAPSLRAAAKRTFSVEVQRMGRRELENAFRMSPLIWKGINRKARDAIKKGFRLLPDGEDAQDEKNLNAASIAWQRATSYKPKVVHAVREALAFGDGFLELVFNLDTANHAKAPPKNAVPVQVYNVDPWSILPVKDPKTGEIMTYLHGPDARDLNRDVVKRYAAGKGPVPKGFRAIHPERIQHFQFNAIGDDPDGLGISVIEPAYINALAMLAGDTAAGDVLEWYSKGFFVLNIEYGTHEELLEAKKMLKAAKAARENFFVGSERSKFDIKSPLLANVKPFYENFYIALAAALEMPTMVLVGNQKGTVTGSQSDLMEYADDMAAFQELFLEDPMYEVFRRVTKRGDFTIKWVPLHVDKQTDADIRFKTAQAAAQVFGAGILTRRQAVAFLRTGELPLPEEVDDGFATGEGPGAEPAAGGPEAGGRPKDGPEPEPDDEPEA